MTIGFVHNNHRKDCFVLHNLKIIPSNETFEYLFEKYTAFYDID